ncbi:MAG TPA: hypothetical protein VE870_13795 [Bacteroidales bacterium]|nr:hypothetical protein [Bacteroidales bacterium]
MKIKLYSSEDLNFVEFSFSSDHDGFDALGKRSRYVHSAVFSLFQDAFEHTDPDFEYYKTSSFSGQDSIKLRNHLVDQLTRIRRIESPEGLEAYALKQVAGIDFLNEIKSSNPNWRISWENLRDQIKHVVDELIEFVDFCIDEEHIFWVKGY